ncbi:MAG: PKD domain-containing protein [Bacteroidales bacterium]|jgi:uncharacterized protein (TIGR02145 family)
MRKLLKYVIPCIILAQSLGCEDKTLNLQPINVLVNVAPSAGLTTTIFKFDLSKSTNPNVGDASIFYRLDWESDGIWDNDLTDQPLYNHRYYKPGIYHVKIEGLDLHGLTDTASIQITVAQGYSKPHPKITISPPKGNPYTRFLFDASGSRDDEDSSNTLKYRWDVNGDGNFETGFTPASTFSFQYGTVGVFNPVVEVSDPGGLTDKVSGQVEVTLWDSLIVADFNWSPDFPVTGEKVVFNAEKSVDPRYPEKKLRYRWDWQSNGEFDTEWSDDFMAEQSFPEEKKYVVKLQVMNYLGLINEITKELLINHKNEPPVASFKTSSIGGNTHTVIRFDSWGTRDFETTTSNLLFRWDFNADGIFDTEFAKGPEIYHRFDEAGQFNVTMEVKDDGGLTDTYSQVVYISQGNNQTDILIDKRGMSWEYYGTVQVGHQWWFSRNLAVQNYQYEQVSYNYGKGNTLLYGYLYRIGVLNFVCPEGWRVPTRKDWDELFSQFPSDSLFEILKPCGRSDLNLTYGGMGDTGPNPNVFNGLNSYGFYWSTTKLADQSAASSWYIVIDKIKNEIWRGFGGKGTEVMSIRCVKDSY